ncbi:MAG: hypothetical protein IT179_22635 [Acidobacteria bacterium]|nr:hypothetical protein [Acidobacteriota bacterium]
MARLRNPFVQAAVLYVVALGFATVAGEAGGMAAMAAMSVFAVLNPLTVAFGRSWWVHTVASSVLFTALLAVLGATPAIATMREGAMIFMLPFMLYAAIVPMGGLVRLWRWRRSQPPQP